MVTYTWSVPMTERNLADGGITVIHWRCDGVDGDYSASSYGTTSHTPDADADGFIAYDSVTKQTKRMLRRRLLLRLKLTKPPPAQREYRGPLNKP